MRTLHDLRDEMLAVAQGTRPVPPVQSVTDGESVSGLLGVLTPANRALMHLIATEHPETASRRVQPDILRASREWAECELAPFALDGTGMQPFL